MMRFSSTPVVLWLSLITGVAGCARVPLVPEESVPEFAALNAASESLPEQATRVPVGPEGRVAVHETGTGTAPRVVVLLHGVLADSRSWRFVRGDLGCDFDLMAVDLPGCGESDRPDPDQLGAGVYAPPALARCVLTALRSRLAARGDDGRTPVTLVAHSLGGTVALRMFGDDAIRKDFADVLDRVDGLVLFTPIDVAVEKDVPSLRAIAEITDLEMAIADGSGLLRMKAAQATYEGACHGSLATVEEAERLRRVLRDRPRRRAAQAMINQAVPTRGGRPHWSRIENIVAGYERVRVPCLIVWGERDELFPVSMGYKLAAQCPGARLRVVGMGTHCLPVERPLLCTRLVREFIDTDAALQPEVTWIDGLSDLITNPDAVQTTGACTDNTRAAN